MNDEIEKFNEQNRKINQGPMPGNFSQAKHSSITSPDEDKRAGMAEKIIGDLSNQRIDIDANKEMLKIMLDEMNGIKIALNQITAVLNGNVQPQTPEQGKMNMEALGQLGDLLEKGISAYKSFKGDPIAAPALINQEFINKRMVESFMDDLDTGKSIGKFIKDSLKKKVTKDVINQSLADMGKDTHEPQ